MRQRRQADFNIPQRGVAGMPGMQGNVLHETMQGHAICPTIVRRGEVRRAHLGRHAFPVADRHSQRAARAKAFKARIARLPKPGMRQARILSGMRRERNAAALKSTKRANRSGSARAAPSPMGPPSRGRRERNPA